MKLNTIAFYGIQDRHSGPYPGYTHDHAICQMQDGLVTAYLQLERHTRRKYDNQLHLHLEEIVEYGWLDQAHAASWIAVNSFVGSSFISQHGRFRIESTTPKRLKPRLQKAKGWGEFKTWAGLPLSAFSIHHELAHVAANLPFYGTFRDNSLLVHFDGGASLSNCSVWLYRKGRLQILDYHWRLSHLSKLFNNNALAFKMLGHLPGEHCAVPGKLMGFATMGTIQPALKQWLRENDYFKTSWESESAFVQQAQLDFGWRGKIADTHDPFIQDLAASIQGIFLEEWLTFLHELQAKTGADFLYLSGGCALNIVANTQILQSGRFQDLFIPPCPNDAGLALGAAAFHQWQKRGELPLHSPFLNNIGLAPASMKYERELVQTVGDAIAAGKAIGLFQGAGEIGPRALGHRSIIARPDSPALARHISMTCKRREWYRPIAPVMREQQALRLTGQSQIHHLSRYMLLDFQIPAAARQQIAGVVHANGTARIQTLFAPRDQPFLWDLLTYLEQQHDIPALINTSFNAQGEPIVHTAQQARASAIQMGLDAVCIDHQFQLFPTPTQVHP